MSGNRSTTSSWFSFKTQKEKDKAKELADYKEMFIEADAIIQEFKNYSADNLKKLDEICRDLSNSGPINISSKEYMFERAKNFCSLIKVIQILDNAKFIIDQLIWIKGLSHIKTLQKNWQSLHNQAKKHLQYDVEQIAGIQYIKPSFSAQTLELDKHLQNALKELNEEAKTTSEITTGDGSLLLQITPKLRELYTSASVHELHINFELYGLISCSLETLKKALATINMDNLSEENRRAHQSNLITIKLALIDKHGQISTENDEDSRLDKTRYISKQTLTQIYDAQEIPRFDGDLKLATKTDAYLQSLLIKLFDIDHPITFSSREDFNTHRANIRNVVTHRILLGVQNWQDSQEQKQSEATQESVDQKHDTANQYICQLEKLKNLVPSYLEKEKSVLAERSDLDTLYEQACKTKNIKILDDYIEILKTKIKITEEHRHDCRLKYFDLSLRLIYKLKDLLGKEELMSLYDKVEEKMNLDEKNEGANEIHFLYKRLYEMEYELTLQAKIAALTDRKRSKVKKLRDIGRWPEEDIEEFVEKGFELEREKAFKTGDCSALIEFVEETENIADDKAALLSTEELTDQIAELRKQEQSLQEEIARIQKPPSNCPEPLSFHIESDETKKENPSGNTKASFSASVEAFLRRRKAQSIQSMMRSDNLTTGTELASFNKGPHL